MIGAEELAHHQQTLRLWEQLGAERVGVERAGDDRRRCVRLLTPESACRLAVGASLGSRTLVVTIRDVCVNGACVTSLEAVPVGEAVLLHPPDGAAPGMEAVAGRVVSCRERPGCYRIGIHFHD